MLWRATVVVMDGRRIDRLTLTREPRAGDYHEGDS